MIETPCISLFISYMSGYCLWTLLDNKSIRNTIIFYTIIVLMILILFIYLTILRLPCAISNTSSQPLHLKKASSSLCKHGGRVWVQFNSICEFLNGLFPLTLNINNLTIPSLRHENHLILFKTKINLELEKICFLNIHILINKILGKV